MHNVRHYKGGLWTPKKTTSPWKFSDEISHILTGVKYTHINKNKRQIKKYKLKNSVRFGNLGQNTDFRMRKLVKMAPKEEKQSIFIFLVSKFIRLLQLVENMLYYLIATQIWRLKPFYILGAVFDESIKSHMFVQGFGI